MLGTVLMEYLLSRVRTIISGRIKLNNSKLILKAPKKQTKFMSARLAPNKQTKFMSAKFQLMFHIEKANSVDPDEVAHNEPPHLDLHCWQIQLFCFGCFNGCTARALL